MSESKHTPGPWESFLLSDAAEVRAYGCSVADVARLAAENAELVKICSELRESLLKCSEVSEPFREDRLKAGIIADRAFDILVRVTQKPTTTESEVE